MVLIHPYEYSVSINPIITLIQPFVEHTTELTIGIILTN